MRVDCQWIASNLEAYFSDRLSPDETRMARTHMNSCPTCRDEVQTILDVDPLIRDYFRQELSIARAPKRLRAWLIPVGATAALGLLIVTPMMVRTPNLPGVPIQERAITVPEHEVEVPAVAKDQQAAGAVRVKPEAGDEAPALPAATPLRQQDSSQQFLVTDPAGYSRSVDDYRGYVLLMGVWTTDQPESITNLQHLYQLLGSDARIRILGVSNQRQARPAAATFPVAYNNGSRLFDAEPNDFVILDEGGMVKMRGSLLSDPRDTSSAIREAMK